MKKIAFIFVLFSLFFSCRFDSDKEKDNDGYVISFESDGVITFYGLKNKWNSSKPFYIPSNLNGKNVTKIAFKSSATWEGCTDIYIPSTVNTIEANAFKNSSSNLSRIYWDKRDVGDSAVLFLPAGVSLYDAISDGSYKKVTTGTGGTIPVIGMTYIQGGSFLMGSESGESDEKPVHNVTVSSFYMSNHEVTQSEYESVMENVFIVNDRPVNVNWYDTIEYCNNLSRIKGLTPCYYINGSTDTKKWGIKGSSWDNVVCDWNANGYRLPTEAEWEFVARGGNENKEYIYSGSNNIDEVSFYKNNSDNSLHNVKQKQPNSLNIYDMSGNVWEWCWDFYGKYSSNDITNPRGEEWGMTRIVRGGSFASVEKACKVNGRASEYPMERFTNVGFRIVHSVETKLEPVSYTVDYISDYGKAPSSITKIAGEILSFDNLPDLKCDGYKFLGWYCDDTKIIPESFSVTENIILTAKWVKEYIITFETERGTAPTSITVEEGDILSLSQLPTLSEIDWIFKGWYIYSGDIKEGTKITSGYKISQNLTLYAKWESESGMILVPGGKFSMGSQSGESNEKPVHEVTVNSFYISNHEVTQHEYFDIMNINPSVRLGANKPVNWISWYDAIEYCNKKSELEYYTPCYSLNGSSDTSNWGEKGSSWNNIICDWNANGYRLPTEAEWEYAAKYGNNNNNYEYSGSNNIDFVAWYKENSSLELHEVMTKQPSKIGLYDMSGNVWEWCWDIYGNYSNDKLTNPHGETSGSEHIIRGGSWKHDSIRSRITRRNKHMPDTTYDDLGFRVVRRVETTPSYTIEYVTGYGTVPSTKRIKQDKALTDTELPDLGFCKGYVFKGWYTDSSFSETTKISIGYSIWQNLKLYAKWEYTGPSEEFVFVEGGTVVGSDDYDNSEYINSDNSGIFPAGTSVTLYDFYISDHEVTQGEYEAVMGCNPSYFNSNPEIGEIQENRPVERISWYDAIYFCNKKSISENLIPCYSVNGKTDPTNWDYTPHSWSNINETISCDFSANGYRLPTETEWEFAARGGIETYGTTAFANYFAGASTTNYTASSNSDLTSVAWYGYNSSGKTHEVKKKLPNALGLYDMSGNVYEWCWDSCGGALNQGFATDMPEKEPGLNIPYSIHSLNSINVVGSVIDNLSGVSSSTGRIARGGCYHYEAWWCSVSYREPSVSGNRFRNIGFRLVCSAGEREPDNTSQNQSTNYSFTSNIVQLPSGTD